MGRRRSPSSGLGARGAKSGAIRLATLIFAFAAIANIAVAQDALPRLPRAAFDVITPSERVAGARGSLTVYQTLCRNGPTSWARRRVVDVAVQEWAFFEMQTI